MKNIVSLYIIEMYNKFGVCIVLMYIIYIFIG